MTNLKINLVDLASIPDSELEKLHTALKYICLFIKYSNDSSKLDELLERHEAYKHLENEAVIMINAYTNEGMLLNPSLITLTYLITPYHLSLNKFL